MEVDLPDKARSASSSYSNDALGTGHHRGRLDSSQAWSAAKREGLDEWYQMNVEDKMFVSGVVTKGRADCDQWVSGFKVETSLDKSTWTAVDKGVVFQGNRDRNTPVYSPFAKPVSAQYVRIWPQSVNGHMSLRAGLLIQDAARRRPSCYYGGSCYNKSEKHKSGYAHPEDWDYEAVDIHVAKDPRCSMLATRLFKLVNVGRSDNLQRSELEMARGMLSEKLKALFMKFDESQDGFISEEELSKIMVKLGMDESQLAVMFKAADLNRDGRIDYDEFVHFVINGAPPELMKDVDTVPMPSLQELDVNHNGIVEKSEWSTAMNGLCTKLGKDAFATRLEAQIHILQRCLGQHGARIFSRGLPEPIDNLQQHALKFVSDMWGEKLIFRRYCQEYGIRSHARITHISGAHEYTPPSTGHMQTFHGGRVTVERVVKVGIWNKAADLRNWAIAYHGIDSHSKESWSKSGPRFLGYGGAHGPGVYTTPAFSVAGAYALRRWTKEWRYDDVPAEFCAAGDMHFIAILMCALKNFKKCGNTADGVAASTEGWGRDCTEWVIPGQVGKPVEEAQIYGVTFCYFRDNPRAG